MNVESSINKLMDYMGVDQDVISELFSEYFIEMEENIIECITLENDKDWDKLARIIHNMKGVSANLSVEDVFLLCAEIEKEVKANIISKEEVKEGITKEQILKLQDMIHKSKQEIFSFLDINKESLLDNGGI